MTDAGVSEYPRCETCDYFYERPDFGVDGQCLKSPNSADVPFYTSDGALIAVDNHWGCLLHSDLEDDE